MTGAERAVEQATAFEERRLPSGLTVLVRTMPGFSGVHAVYGTRFGSVDRAFSADGRTVRLPAGTAHFLEHKMFESEDGDAFSLYAKTGASANAYTGFDRTCYIFTATSRIEENLDILLGFVSKPYFTDATVRKEQGIIGQEIKMYDDSPDWKLVFTVYECLYHNHPLRDDIAGSVESIAEITPELLYACTDAFYRPQNMTLAVAGNVTMDTVLAAVERAHLAAKPGEVRRIRAEEPAGVRCARRELTMDIAKPMLGLGFKEAPCAPENRLRTELLCEVLCEVVCGSMTPLYRRLYDEGLVNSGFSGESLVLDDAVTVCFGGETAQPEQVRKLLLDEIARLRREGVDETLFTLCKNELYGELIAGLESVDDVAAGLFSSHSRGRTLAQEIEALASLTKRDADEALQTMLREENSATVIIRPTRGA